MVSEAEYRVFRLQKYDPEDYDEYSRYTKEDWTDVSDIGRIFSGRRLDQTTYIRIEDAFVLAIRRICDYLKVDNLITKIEEWVPESVDSIENVLLDTSLSEALSFKTGETVSGKRFETFVRLCLQQFRGYFALTNERDFSIQFLDDMYVFVICKKDLQNKLELPKQLFLIPWGPVPPKDEAFLAYLQD